MSEDLAIPYLCDRDRLHCRVQRTTTILDFVTSEVIESALASCWIGNEVVEGACKNMIGRRLKQTGARWRVRRVNRMAGLCSNMYSKQWNRYWKTLAA